MRIWWAYRASMEGFLFFSISFYFMGAGGYWGNLRRRYIYHKAKRTRSYFCNPYFVAPKQRVLSYDKQFNVQDKDLLASLKAA